MKDVIQFLFRGRIEEVIQPLPNLTVLNWLRERQGATGTKEGCAEGDCGACTVLVGSLHSGKLEYRPVNACIRFLPTLDGTHLITIEDLMSDDLLHPIQKAMVEHHGSQCGFCTPGIIISLFGLYLEKSRSITGLTRKEIDDALAGNLCRCTGYGSIISAAYDAFSSKRSGWVEKNIQETTSLVESIRPKKGVTLDAHHQLYFAPTTLEHALGLVKAYPDATLLSGGTDIALQVTKRFDRLDKIIYLGQIEHLKSISKSNEGWTLGSGVTFSQIMGISDQIHPHLLATLERVGSVQIRNAGTIGGNIANASPVGDLSPLLMCLNAVLTLRTNEASRKLPIEEFFIEYGKTALRSGELIESIFIPRLPANSRFSSYKVSKRHDQDISTLLGAFRVDIDQGIIIKVIIAFGGMAEIPKRADNCEQALHQQPWSPAILASAAVQLSNDYSPIDDFRGSAKYRSRVAVNLLHRFWLEQANPEIPHRINYYPDNIVNDHA
jgi:xanthine dehydrogenase small subunit